MRINTGAAGPLESPNAAPVKLTGVNCDKRRPYQKLNPSTTKSPKACARCAGFSASYKRIARDEPDLYEKYRLADLVLSFKGAKKALPLNMTNWDSVAEITGEGDTARWPGRALELYPTTTTMQGKTVPCIRIRGAGPARVADGQAARADATADAGRPRRQNSVLSCPGPAAGANAGCALREDLPTCCAPHWREPSEDCIFAARCAQLRLTLKCPAIANQ